MFVFVLESCWTNGRVRVSCFLECFYLGHRYLCLFLFTHRVDAQSINRLLTGDHYAEIGVALTGLGALFLFLGMVFLFDRGLLAMGNVCSSVDTGKALHVLTANVCCRFYLLPASL